MNSRALIFNLQRYSLHDGPGIRTLVFFKGCPLRCVWCSNPEGIHRDNEVRYIMQRCDGCSLCASRCPRGAVRATPHDGFVIDRDACDRCGACITACRRKAKIWSGYEIGIEELMTKIRKDKAFYDASGGGVTLGGGDPLAQAGFAEELLVRCKAEGIGAAIETECFCDYDTLERCALLCDIVLADFKADNEETHLALTGVSNAKIKENLSRLDRALASGKTRLAIRIPLLPEINFTLYDMKKAAGFFKTLHAISYIEILPFHNLGESKYQQLGLPYQMQGRDNLKSTDVMEYADILKKEGLNVTVTDW